MRILVVKTSSLGDIIHTLPALTDARQALPGIQFDWIVEENFAQIPAWHPAVDRVIPVALRRWRRHPIHTLFSEEWKQTRRAIGSVPYYAVIDAQGLLKSAWLTRYAKGPIHGLDRRSAREPLANLFYDHHHPVAWGQHAVERVRALFSQVLDYRLPSNHCDYGLAHRRPSIPATVPYLIFLHGTTWTTKHWPEIYWRRLAELAVASGWEVRLPWGNAAEAARAQRLGAGLDRVRVLPALDLAGIATELAGARACVAVDTGLGHLAAAFGVPALSLFGPTKPAFTGAWGTGQHHLASDFPCAPCFRKRCHHTASESERRQFDLTLEQPLCFTRLSPERVWQEFLSKTLSQAN